jgi:mRNA interferase RelE/StbE
MLVKIDRSFEKDIRKITDKNTLKRVASVIRQVQKADNLSEIKNLKKLSISDNEYRIRIGSYRIGVIISDEIIEFVRCLHRKDIYKYFPK